MPDVSHFKYLHLTLVSVSVAAILTLLATVLSLTATVLALTAAVATSTSATEPSLASTASLSVHAILHDLSKASLGFSLNKKNKITLILFVLIEKNIKFYDTFYQRIKNISKLTDKISRKNKL